MLDKNPVVDVIYKVCLTFAGSDSSCGESYQGQRVEFPRYQLYPGSCCNWVSSWWIVRDTDYLLPVKPKKSE